MGWIKAHREARRMDAAMFGITWMVSIKLLDELAALYDETNDPARKRNILYEYARYATGRWMAILNHTVTAEPSFDFDTIRPSAYFPAHFSDTLQVARWADSKRINRSEVTRVIVAYMQLTP